MSEKVYISDLISAYSLRNTENRSLPVYSVTNSHGFTLSTEYFNKKVFSKDTSNYKIVPFGAFAYNPSRINVGSISWQDKEKEVIVSPLYNVFTLKHNVDARYLNYFFHSPYCMTYINAYATGSVRNTLDLKSLGKIPIILPEEKEQKRVVKILDCLIKIITHRKQALELMNELVKSRFVEMFGGIHNSSLYPYVTIECFTTVISGGTPNRGISEYWQDGRIRWVKSTELHNCVITDTEEKITQLGMSNSSAKLIPADSVLIAMYGQGKTRGMTGYLAVTCTTNQACACILPSPTVNQKYLWQYMILSYDKLRNMAKGGNQPNLNVGIIKKFPVLMPPLELQVQFAAFVSQIDKSRLAIQKSLDEAQLLFDSLMQKYFG